MPLRWRDADAIAKLLLVQFPDIDPLIVRFPDLQRWVVELDDFDDDPKPSSPILLELIQRHWYEVFEP